MNNEFEQKALLHDFLNLKILRRFSELISPAAKGASNVSDDRDLVLTAKNITT